jgi:hypothetical protein
MADTATFSGALKTKFLGPIRDVLPKGHVLLYGDPEANPTDFKGIVPSAEGISFVGNEFRIPMKTGRNQSVGFRSENELLPAPGASKYTFISEPLRYAYSLFNITGQLMNASESNDGAFVNAFKQEMEDSVLSSKLDFARAAFGDGSGKMANVTSGTSGSASVVLDSTINFRGLGEVVDFTTSAGVIVSAGHTVTAVNRGTLTITVSPVLAATLTAGTHFPVRASLDSTISVPNNSLNKEINGLSNIVSNSGTLHGLSPTQYSWWASQLNPGAFSGGAINDTVLRNAKDGVGFEAGIDIDNGFDFAMITTRGIRSRYGATLTALKRFSGSDVQTLKGGYTALMFDENPIFIDDLCPVGSLFGLSLNKLFWSQGDDWNWMNKDGDVLKWEPRRDRYIAVLYKYCNLGTTWRGAHFRLTGVTDDVR